MRRGGASYERGGASYERGGLHMRIGRGFI